MQCFNLSNEVRSKEFFGFDWQFALTDSLNKPDIDTEWRDVQLPHDWSVDYPISKDAPSCGSGGYARTGIGWYKRSFDLVYGNEQQLSLLFDGVYMNCTVWINDICVGGHVYGYTPFALDITSAVHEGRNDILVRVDNSHQPGSRWYSGSGITRDVWLEAYGQVHIAQYGMYVKADNITPQNADISIEISTIGHGESITLVPKIKYENDICLQGTPVKACAGHTVRTVMHLPEPKIWDIDTPYMYTASVRVMHDDQLLDEVSIPFGVREIAYNAEDGFLLNGRKVLLRGACLHHDGGCVGAAVPKAVWLRRLKKLKEMGCNALRCSHNPPDPNLLELADEMGFAVMDEAFDEWQLMKGKEFGSNTHESRGYSEWFDACWQEDMTAMLLRDRNHPSIVMWSIGNEIREQVDPLGWQVAHKLVGLCHALDATRPVVAACDQVKAEPTAAYTQFIEQLDILGVNYTDRWRSRTETFFDEEKIEHPDWLLLGTEDVGAGGIRGNYSIKNTGGVWGRNSYYSQMLKAEKLWKYVATRRFVIGDFMWTGIDYLGECFWPEKGASCGILDTCGFEKDGFYFYKSQWVKDEPVLHVFPNLNLDVEKGTVIPVIAYTNCHTVELFVNGHSWGVKAYEFPAQGMTKEWPHFDRPLAPVTTNDLHLTWDIPYNPDDEWIAIGRDESGNEIARQVIKHNGIAQSCRVESDCNAIKCDGRSVVQVDIALCDVDGNIAVNDDRDVSISVSGGTLLGMDNGNPKDITMFPSSHRSSFHGLTYAIIRKDKSNIPLDIKITADGLPTQQLIIPIAE